MRLTCPNCGATYGVAADAMPPGGSHVQCSSCHTRWFVRPRAPAPERLSEEQIIARLENRVRPRLAGGTEVDAADAGAAATDAPAEPPDLRGAPNVAAPVSPARDDAVASGAGAPIGAPSARSRDVVEASSVPAEVRGGRPTPAAHTPLRPRPQGQPALPAPPAAPAASGGGGRVALGALTALAVGGAALALYLRAGEATARAPAAATALAAYTAAVDETRAAIEARLGPLRDRLLGRPGPDRLDDG